MRVDATGGGRYKLPSFGNRGIIRGTECMGATPSWLLALGLSLPAGPADLAPVRSDPAHLREMLQDRQHPRLQSQAALLLVQDRSSDATEIIRQGLQQTESQEIFLALADALRLCRDRRFVEELL